MSTSKAADGSLRTARLWLRGPKPSDLAAMHRVYSDPRAMRFWATDPHPDPDVTAALLQRRIDRWSERQTNFQIVLNGSYIGNVGNFRDDEIGFMLDPDQWNKGYISEALTIVLPTLFHRTTHKKLIADVDPRNSASIATLQKFGFHETHRATATFFIGGAWCDSVYYALDRQVDDRARHAK